MSATSVLARPESDYTFDYSEKTSSNTYYNTNAAFECCPSNKFSAMQYAKYNKHAVYT